jgi:hypothetical protein
MIENERWIRWKTDGVPRLLVDQKELSGIEICGIVSELGLSLKGRIHQG